MVPRFCVVKIFCVLSYVHAEMNLMTQIVLIHGFATGIRFSIFRKAHGADAGFSAFQEDVNFGDAKAFRWDIKEDASFLQSLNPYYPWGVYRREKAIVENRKTHEALARFLANETPRTIVCHSMGARLMIEYLKHEPLPSSVRCIILNQADVAPADLELSRELMERMRQGNLQFINTFCPWDPSLWYSRAFHGPRAGLVGLSRNDVQNKFFPLVKPVNLHTAAIRSHRFRDLIEKLLECRA